MADTPNTPPPEPTLASMTDRQRMDYARKVGSAEYSKRLIAESRAAAASAPPPSVPAMAPRAAMDAIRATAGLAESDHVDLTTLDDAQRRQWIGRHGLAKYTAKLRQDLKGKTNFLARRR